MSSDDQLVALQQTLYTSRNPTRRWLHCTRRDWIIATLRRIRPAAPLKAMEVGPGSGIYLPVLAELFNEVVASDVQEAFLRNARTMAKRFPNLHMVADDITASKLPDNSFDLILCTEVIEHIANSKLAIREMFRLLRKGGILVLSTPQRYSPLEICAKIALHPRIINLTRFVYREPVLETGHINLMTAREVVRQLEQAGFHIVEHHRTGFYLPVVAELMGETGLKIERWLESKLRHSPFDGLLWTQYYIAEVR